MRAESGLVDEEEALCCMTYYRVRELRHAEVVSVRPSRGISFDHLGVCTLRRQVCLEVAGGPGEKRGCDLGAPSRSC